MNELYEFMKQVDVIVLFCLIYGLAINGIVWTVCEVIRLSLRRSKPSVKSVSRKRLHRMKM